MKQIQALISAVIKELFGHDIVPVLTRPDEQFGEYATNSALQLAKQVGKNPREVAAIIAERLQSDDIETVEVAGPGFINIRLRDSAIITSVADALSTQPNIYAGKIVVVEYSDPNPFKPLHAGHLYTTLVGDTIARLVETSGAQVVRINYGGDVGLHVGKSMWAILAHLGGEFPEKLTEIAEAERPHWLGARYVEGNNAYEENTSAKEEIVACNKRVYQVQQENDHDSAFAKIYWECRAWSYDYFRVLYQELQVAAFDRYIPESEVTPLAVKTVHEQFDAGVYKQSDGAIIFMGEDYGLHTRVFINSAGLPTYEAKDVGLLLTKWQDYHFDASIVITANEQAQYMEVMLKSVEQFAPEPAGRSKHLTHGMVRLRGGVKMSSRKGNIVSALDIIDAARRAGEASGTHPNRETVLAAVKYAFAKIRIGGDIAYDPIESIALEGNSGPYLQYAHARARSILAKIEDGKLSLPADLLPAERTLARKISEYPEVVQLSITELMPHHICSYLYELAQTFNRFYEDNRVIGSERQEERLWLVTQYADTLRAGLTLIGIHAPNKM